jgi:uncharacterized protein YdhG (YjbR/CyaY superfamily)
MNILKNYIAQFGSPHKEALLRIQSLVIELAPQATEALSYNMPAYKINGEYLIWFAAFKNHISIFPTSDDMVRELGEEVARRRTSTGTLQFTIKDPLPEDLIKDVIRYRLRRIAS